MGSNNNTITLVAESGNTYLATRTGDQKFPDQLLKSFF